MPKFILPVELWKELKQIIMLMFENVKAKKWSIFFKKVDFDMEK